VNNKRNLLISIGILILVAALVGIIYLMQPSAEDILIKTLETAETITDTFTDGHAVVEINVDSIEQDASGTIEVWARSGEDGPGAFRMEVLEASEEKAQGAIIVFDGETLWVFSPSENKVFVGTPKEAQAMMEDNQFMEGDFAQFREGMEGKPEDGEDEHPETAEEVVKKLLEYFNAEKSGSGEAAGENAYLLKLEPIPEQMPAEYTAVGGYLNLWIGQDSSLPLGAAYAGGSYGEFTATVLEFEFNQGVDETFFSFEVPAGAEVVTFADLEPQSLTLEEAGESVEFDFLTPAETPPGATLVDILEVRGALVQRYTLPEGGSFTIAQGIIGGSSDDTRTPPTESQPIDVRGATGQLFEGEDSNQVLLTWTEGDLFYSVAGDLTAEQALSIAESLQ
jgi:outer membrane lipoprotein-sorting protein